MGLTDYPCSTQLIILGCLCFCLGVIVSTAIILIGWLLVQQKRQRARSNRKYGIGGPIADGSSTTTSLTSSECEAEYRRRHTESGRRRQLTRCTSHTYHTSHGLILPSLNQRQRPELESAVAAITGGDSSGPSRLRATHNSNLIATHVAAARPATHWLNSATTPVAEAGIDNNSDREVSGPSGALHVDCPPAHVAPGPPMSGASDDEVFERHVDRYGSLRLPIVPPPPNYTRDDAKRHELHELRRQSIQFPTTSQSLARTAQSSIDSGLCSTSGPAHDMEEPPRLHKRANLVNGERSATEAPSHPPPAPPSTTQSRVNPQHLGGPTNTKEASWEKYFYECMQRQGRGTGLTNPMMAHTMSPPLTQGLLATVPMNISRPPNGVCHVLPVVDNRSRLASTSGTPESREISSITAAMGRSGNRRRLLRHKSSTRSRASSGEYMSMRHSAVLSFESPPLPASPPPSFDAVEKNKQVKREHDNSSDRQISGNSRSKQTHKNNSTVGRGTVAQDGATAEGYPKPTTCRTGADRSRKVRRSLRRKSSAYKTL